MRRSVLLLCHLLLLAGAARADEDRGDVLVRTLQAHVDRATGETAPSVACICVSRSDAYARAPYWGTGERPDSSGRLGAFDVDAARKRVPLDVPNRRRILRDIRNHDLSDPAVPPESYGSGFVVDDTGLILTNAHVVRNASKIYVRLSGDRSSWADIHACDARSDLAVLKLIDSPAGLKALSLGDGGAIRAGKFILALANAYAPGFRGGTPTVNSGMVNAVRQPVPVKGSLTEMDPATLTLHHYGTLIQMDAKTTPGCSGGAIVDLDGRVIGLTTALAGVSSDTPGGFAIPFDANTRQIIEVLKRGEEVEYGFLGVRFDRLEGPQRFNGVRLTGVEPGSPAALAGLQVGDQILSVNANRVRDTHDLLLYIGMALAGSTARVEVSRGLGRRVVTVKLAKYYVRGQVIASKRPPAKFGLRVDYNSILSQRNPFPMWTRTPSEGVVVREVVPGSPADKARLQQDKIITAVNGKLVTTPAEYYEEIARTGNKVELTFLNSEGRSQRLTLQDP